MYGKITFVVLFLTVLSCKAQIIPVEDTYIYRDAGNGYPAGTTYIKDVNNVLNKFTGTWKGSYQDYDLEVRELYVSRLSISPIESSRLEHETVHKKGVLKQAELFSP